MHTTSNILMIEPVAFGFNEQTAVNNYFQQNEETPSADIQKQALIEFNAMVEKLRANKINVIVVKDTPDPHTPDSIFPNNWVSFHSCGTVVLYPMCAPNRRFERRFDILEILKKDGFLIKEIFDLSPQENHSLFLEGTGSMVLDRENHIAYASLSERTNTAVLSDFCEKLNYKNVFFNSYQDVEGQWKLIYHTNVIMCVADSYVVICLDSVGLEENFKETLLNMLQSTDKTIIEITESQMHNFAGNMLQVHNEDGDKLLIMSKTAYNSLNLNQIAILELFNKIITVDIPTIEKIGGGSARCMMAEVFLPKIS
jgi:hypothetical protein